MKICIFGAGAIGGLMAAKLALKGEAEVTVIARGPHLAAMQADGLRLVSEGQEVVTRPRCVASAEEAGPQDYVVVTLKAHSLPGAAQQMQPLLGPDTAVVSAVNGVPWWYFHGVEGAHSGRIVESVDPGGVVTRLLPPSRAIGCIVYPAAEVSAPGVIEHTYGDRFSLGEPDGSRSPRAQKLSEALIADDEQRGVARAMMLEGQRVAEALGIRFAIDVDKRIAGAAEVGAHKTSMLQDLERGRPMEVEALLGAVVELADLVGEPAATCRTVLSLVRARARAAGCL